jgi:hypothetical protein
MAAPQFVKTGVSVSPLVFSRAAVYPKVEPLILNQFVGVSDANTVQVAIIGPPLETISLQFQQLIADDVTNIKAFFADPLVDYAANEFTFIDSDGISHTVRYLENQLAMPEESNGQFTWELILTKV